MDVLLMIICGTLVLSFLVLIHEGGHFLAARAFGVRVTELMLGMPGPNIGFKHGDTKFGVTPILLGGYARICGMEPGEIKPHVKEVLAALYKRGTADMEDIAKDCGITDDEAYECLEELVEWGSCTGPRKTDEFNTYRAKELTPTRKQVKAAAKAGELAPASYKEGEARPVEDAQALYDSEYKQQYRALPFWKRSIILIAGPGINLVFAVLAFILIYSVIGIDYQNTQTGEVMHFTATPWQSIVAGFTYIGMVCQAVIELFNPATAADTVANSSSIVGIVVMSKDAFEMGFTNALFFTAAISVSLGIMNMLPIPPLDGGRFIVEIAQKITGKTATLKVMNGISMAGMALVLGFGLFMINQDIQRLITGTFFGQ